MVRAVAPEGADQGKDGASETSGTASTTRATDVATGRAARGDAAAPATAARTASSVPRDDRPTRGAAPADAPVRTSFAEPPATLPTPTRPAKPTEGPGSAVADRRAPAAATGTAVLAREAAVDEVVDVVADPVTAASSAESSDDTAATDSGRRGTRSAIVWVVVGAVVVQMSLRLWGSLGGWFFADDFWRQDLTTRVSLADLAFSGLGGHLSPLMWVVLYPFTAATLFNWPAQIAFMVGLWLLIDLLVLLLFRRLWGWSWPTGVAFALFAVSTFTAPSFLWSGQVWLGGLNVLGVVAMLLAVSRAAERASLGRLLVAWATVAAAVLLSERNALDAVFVGIFALVAFAPAAGGVLPFLRRTWALYVGSVLLLGAYAVFYLTTVGRGSDDPMFAVTPTSGELLEKLVAGLGQSVAPGILGGPWFTDGESVVARAAVPSLIAFLAIELVAAVLVALVVLRRRGLASVVLLVTILLGNLALIAVARSAFGGTLPMQEWRYYANLAVWVPLLGTLALVPARSPGTGTTVATYPEPVRRSVARHPVVWSVVGLALLNGALVTTYAAAVQFRASQARPFLERTLSDLTALGEVTIADRQLPPEVIPALLTTQTMASRVLSAATPRPSFATPTPTLYAIADDGAVRAARIDGGSVTRPGPDGSCGTAVRAGDTQRLRLTNELFDWTWWAKVDYLAQADGALRIKAGGDVISAPVAKGPGSVYVPVTGPVDDIFVTAGSEGGVCVAGIQVGLGVADVPAGP